MKQFIKFGLVGGSGVIVNLIAAAIALKFGLHVLNVTAYDPFYNLFGTQFHIRWFHVFQTFAFLVANTWNYQLNRSWTFGGIEKRSWIRGFFPFLLTGVVAFLVSLAISTALLNPTSPIALPTDILDDSSGLRNRFYWANAISILFSMPVNFVINKLWTFRTKKPTRIVVDAKPA